jgi:titin
LFSAKESIIHEIETMQYEEDSTRRREDMESIVTQAPKFVTKLNGPTQLNEGQSAHFECRIEPYPDPNLKVEWFHNGQPLQTGHRFRTTYDFGFSALDILTVYAEDAGEYMCIATNRIGKAMNSIKITVKCKSSVEIKKRIINLETIFISDF